VTEVIPFGDYRPMKVCCRRCDLVYTYVAFGIHVCDEKRVFLRLLDDAEFRAAVCDKLDRAPSPKRSWWTRLLSRFSVSKEQQTP
jgi:hypothetical protein